MPEFLSIGFMQKAFIGGTIISVVLAFISFFVVLRGLSFIGVGISHSAFGGVALGVLLGIEPFWTAIAFCLVVANLITLTSRTAQFGEDTIIGIFFALTMGMGVIMIGFSKTYVDLFGYLFGNILAISKSDIWAAGAVGFIVIVSASLVMKELLLDSFDRDIARASGVPVRVLDHLLTSLIALSIVISIKLVGIVLASALLVIPGATALKLTAKWRAMLALSIFAALISTFGGILLAYYFDLAPGASITVMAALLFFLSMIK
jgi:zinc transport system permease protein